MGPSAEDIARYTPAPEPYRAPWTARAPAWLDELDLTPAPPYHRMGTRALHPADWLMADRWRDRELALRHRLLDERRHDVFAARPSARSAAVETRALVHDWLTARGLPADRAGDDPLVDAARLVQEDLCLLIERDGAWHLDAGVVCFPSLWRLADKIGRPIAAVHGPVPRYDDELATRVDRFLGRLTADRPVWRRNLSIKATHALFLPPVDGDTGAPVEPDADGAPYWLRTERQTLRKLPESGAILFTIRTQLAPVSVLHHRPDRARDLLRAYDPRAPRGELPAGLRAWIGRIAGDC